MSYFFHQTLHYLKRCETKVSAMSDSVDTPVKENEEQQVGDFDYGECIVLELTISL